MGFGNTAGTIDECDDRRERGKWPDDLIRFGHDGQWACGIYMSRCIAYPVPAPRDSDIGMIHMEHGMVNRFLPCIDGGMFRYIQRGMLYIADRWDIVMAREVGSGSWWRLVMIGRGMVDPWLKALSDPRKILSDPLRRALGGVMGPIGLADGR